MALNKIVKGKDNPVIFNFTFGGEFALNGLSNFDEIILTIGSESYSTVSDPANLIVASNTQLELRIGDTTNLDSGYYTPEIVGYEPLKYDDGYLLSGKCNNILGGVITVC